MLLRILEAARSRRRARRSTLQVGSRQAGAVLLAAALTCGASAMVATPAAGAEGAATLHSVPSAVWPADADGGQGFTAVVDVWAAGEYFFQITREATATSIASLSMGHLEPGTYTWTWDGRRNNGDLPSAGGHELEFFGTTDDGTYYYDVTERRSFSVRYSTETVTVADRLREPSSQHVDVSSFDLTNSPREVVVAYRFRDLRAAALTYLHAALDVDQLRRGYLVTAQRTKSGWRQSVHLAVLASDQGRAKKVACPGAQTQIDGLSVSMTIPRSCLRRGGKSVRAEWSVYDRHHHGDWWEHPTNYWTPWATYAVPPA